MHLAFIGKIYIWAISLGLASLAMTTADPCNLNNNAPSTVLPGALAEPHMIWSWICHCWQTFRGGGEGAQLALKKLQ